jgi:LEA14-like dessication related protein
MKNKGLLIGAGVLAVVAAGYKSWNVQQSIKFFQYCISSFKISFRNLLNPSLVFGIKVFNPNKTAVPLNEFFGTLKYGNTLVASFRNEGAVNVGGNEESIVTINAKVNLLGTVLQQLFGNNANAKLTVDGKLKTPFFDMPVTKVISMSDISGTNTKSFLQ